MVRFYIVDDENMIREGLQYYFNWSDFGAEVIGSQINGQRALPEILEKEPDVVITDVVMPKMDGIELARQLRLNGYNGELIFLSAYQELSYIKTAFKLAAADYIFKPIQTDELESTVKRLVSRVLDKRSKQQALLDAKNFIQKSEQIQQKKLWRSLLYSDQSLSLSEEEIRKELMISPNCYGFYVLLVYSPSVSSQNLIDHIDCWSLDLGRHLTLSYALAENNNTICVIVGFENASYGLPIKAVMTQQQLLRKLYPYANDVVVVSGELTSRLLKIAHSRRNAAQMLLSTVTVSLPQLFEVESADSNSDKKDWAKQLEDYAFSSESHGSAEKIIHSYLKHLQKLGLKDLDIIKSNCLMLCFAACENMAHIVPEEKKTVFLNDISNIVKCISCSEISDCLANDLCAFQAALKDSKNEREIVIRLRNYINGDLENSSISLLAQKTGMSKNYLSLQFKKITGVTINDFITLQRINKAKILLLETDKYIYEIASEIGYKDVAYFSQLFKQYTGYMPVKYKERANV